LFGCTLQALIAEADTRAHVAVTPERRPKPIQAIGLCVATSLAGARFVREKPAAGH